MIAPVAVLTLGAATWLRLCPAFSTVSVVTLRKALAGCTIGEPDADPCSSPGTRRLGSITPPRHRPRPESALFVARGRARWFRGSARQSYGVLVSASSDADRWGVAAGAVTFLGCSWLASGGIDSPERAVFEQINHRRLGLRPWLTGARQLGIGPALPAMAGCALAARQPRLAAAALLSLPIEKAFEVAAKKLAGRRRPARHVVRSHLHRDAPTSGGSYPSGHAAVSTTIVLLTRPYVPRLVTVLGATVAAAGSAGRVYQGAHYPLDVIGGAALGLMAGCAVNVVVPSPDA
jgi:hypothetical protein